MNIKDIQMEYGSSLVVTGINVTALILGNLFILVGILEKEPTLGVMLVSTLPSLIMVKIAQISKRNQS